jgi:hypothetical protein
MMRGASSGTKRTHRLVVALVVAAIAVSACSDDSDPEAAAAEDPVEIGPGSEGTPPAAAIVEEAPGAEPSWVDRVPAIAAPQAPVEARVAALDLAGSSALSPPPTKGSAGATAAGSRNASTESDYSGTMSIEIAYYDYCQTYDGNLGFAGSAEYKMAAEVFIQPPAEERGVRERSPFNLLVGSETGVEGTIQLWSAQLLTDTRDGRSALFDYWDISQQGDEISGVLTDRWAGLPTYNFIEATQLLIPCRPELGTLVQRDSIAEGAELTGTVTEDRVELEVIAQSLDRELRFRAVIEADRAD